MPEGSTRKTGFIVALAGLFCLTAISTDVLISALPDIERAFDIRPGQGQFMITFFVGGFAIGQLIWGPVSDAIGRRPVVLVSLVAFVLFAALRAQADSFVALVAFRFLQGIFGGAGPTIARAIVQDVSSGEDSVRLMSLLTIILGFSPVVGPLLSSLMLTLGSWTFVFLFIVLYGCGTLLFSAISLNETNHARSQQMPLAGFRFALRRYLAEPSCRAGAILALLTFGGFYAILTGSPIFASDVYGISGEQFGAFFSFVGGGWIIGSLLSRLLASRWSLERVLALGVSLMVVGGASGAISTWLGLDLAILWGSCSIYTVGVGIVFPGSIVYAMRQVPDIAGAAAAFTSLAQLSGGIVAATLVGVLYNGTAFPMVIVMSLAALGAGLLFLIVIRRTD